MTRFNPETQIAIVWSVEDVKAIRPELSDKQAMEVLQQMKNKHDANIGINWEVIECVAEMLFPKQPEECNKR